LLNATSSDEVSGCTDETACNYNPEAIEDDGSCEYEYDCAGTCGGNLEPDCCGVCGGDNSQCSNCCGSPLYEDCTDDCAIDLNGECCYELELMWNTENIIEACLSPRWLPGPPDVLD